MPQAALLVWNSRSDEIELAAMVDIDEDLALPFEIEVPRGGESCKVEISKLHEVEGSEILVAQGVIVPAPKESAWRTLKKPLTYATTPTPPRRARGQETSSSRHPKNV